MHDVILAAYFAFPARAELRYLVSDEVDTTAPGGRKNRFSTGGLYWSAATGVVPVTGGVYPAYENLRESATHGFPVAVATPVAGGVEQQFQGARFFAKRAAILGREVHGAVLAKYLVLGGPAGYGSPPSAMATPSERPPDATAAPSTGAQRPEIMTSPVPRTPCCR